MSIDSISDGASVESGLVVVIVVKLGSVPPRVNLSTPAVPTGTPSITYNGWLSPLVEVAPRICTEIPPPGAASPCVTVAPGTLPWSACCRLTTAVFWIWSGGTETTAPVRSARRCVPYPTTTTSDSETATVDSVKSAGTDCPATTTTVCSWGVNPMRLARPRGAPSGTSVRTEPPSSCVTTPRSVPTTVTRTPSTGRAVGASVTWPVIVPVGAWARSAPPTSAPLSTSQAQGRRLMTRPPYGCAPPRPPLSRSVAPSWRPQFPL